MLTAAGRTTRHVRPAGGENAALEEAPRCMKRVERVERTAAVIGAAVLRSHAVCLAC